MDLPALAGTILRRLYIAVKLLCPCVADNEEEEADFQVNGEG